MSDGSTTPPEAPELDPSHEWFKNVYQGERVRQLSVRSIVTGMLIGGVMSVSNLYVGLKTGWGLGVTITASIIAYAVFQALEQIIPAYKKNPFTILENYTMSSAASAAGYMASAGLVSAIPALYLTTGRSLTALELMLWIGAVSMLGVFMAIPMKRQMIDIEQLPFPSGIATAETLKSMHTEGTEAMDKAKSLLWGGVIGGFVVLWRDALPMVAGWLGTKLKSPKLTEELSANALPTEFPLLPGAHTLLEKLTIGFEGSLIMIAAGAIMGIRVGISLLIGAVIFYGILAPILIEQGIIGTGYRDIVSWTLWPATAMMVSSGLLSFALNWRTILKSLFDLVAMFRGESDLKKGDPMRDIEVPTSWFLIGTVTAGTACVVLGHRFFNIHYGMGILAVVMTFFLSIVAARATGETDVTPIGAMGKITQLVFGLMSPRPEVAGQGAASAIKVLVPAPTTAMVPSAPVSVPAIAAATDPATLIVHANITTNLMTASITAGAASHAADLLTDLKTGYLLGGNPRKQTISQLFGVVAGTLVCVPVYMLVVDPTKLGSPEMPAPSAKVWQKVAELVAKGWEALHPTVLVAIIVGAIIGIVLTMLEETLPAKSKKWLPSTTALGLAGVIPAFNCISMFLGALIAWILSRTRRDLDEKYTVPFSSGLIAGESLLGMGLIMLSQGPLLLATLYNQSPPWLQRILSFEWVFGS